MNELNFALFEKLARLQWLMRRQRHRNFAKNGPTADATRGQGRIIALLKMQDGISTRDLSYLLGIRVSSLNELLAKMEKNGYITREPSEADKRVMLTKLTEKGRSEPQDEWNPSSVFACLSAEEQQSFAAYLDRIIEAVEAELGPDTDEDSRAWWVNEARARMGDEAFERLASPQWGNLPPGARFDPRFGPRFGYRPGPHSAHCGHPGCPPEAPDDKGDE